LNLQAVPPQVALQAPILP